MKKIINTAIFTLSFIFITSFSAHIFAQNSDIQTGQSVYTDLQSGKTSCTNLSDDQFRDLGEFYMQRIAGSSFNTMDQRMDNMMGSPSTDQMYITLGKRISGCDTNAMYPSPVNNMMGYFNNYGPSMMNGYNGGFLGAGYMMQNLSGLNPLYGLLFILILLALLIAIILGIVVLVRQIRKK